MTIHFNVEWFKDIWYRRVGWRQNLRYALYFWAFPGAYEVRIGPLMFVKPRQVGWEQRD